MQSVQSSQLPKVGAHDYKQRDNRKFHENIDNMKLTSHVNYHVYIDEIRTICSRMLFTVSLKADFDVSISEFSRQYSTLNRYLDIWQLKIIEKIFEYEFHHAV